jgi:ribosomal protein S18 acetylase RimI-like enzyme
MVFAICNCRFAICDLRFNYKLAIANLIAMLPIICKTSIVIEPATLADLPAIDALQKQFGKALGYFPTAQLKGYIEMGGVLVATREQRHEGRPPAAREPSALRHEGEEGDTPSVPSVPPCHRAAVPELLGYIISRDRYLKRDELGVIFQLCVEPGAHRKLIGASLVKAAFERSAYGCKLFCLWCAQDLEANYFWESLGFVPVAFRTGSGKRKRVHIFWQRRVRADVVVTPYWFPAQTSNGAIREDRLVLPIPVGVHWSDEMPILLPRTERAIVEKAQRKKLPGPVQAGKLSPRVPVYSRFDVRQGGLRSPLRPQIEDQKVTDHPKPARQKQEAVKIDPKLLAAARELRDRWLERMNCGELGRIEGKYEIARLIDGPRERKTMRIASVTRALPAPAAA